MKTIILTKPSDDNNNQFMPLPTLTCLRCGYTWIPREEKPKQCPNCKSPKWDEKPNDKEKEHEPS